MEFEDREEEVMLVMEEWSIPYPFASYRPGLSMCQCRICHEEEEESSTSMESPCACSGSLKFAHRGCIQRWCDEKGNIHCEICLQDFVPGYSVAPKTAIVDVGAAIRQDQGTSGYDESSDDEAAIDDVECLVMAARVVSYCRSIALTFTILLLLRHLISVIALGVDHHPLTLLIVFASRASGILLPFYFMMRTITAVQTMHGQCHHHHHHQRNPLHVMDETLLQEEGQLQHHTIQIGS